MSTPVPAEPKPASAVMLWTGRVLSLLPALMLIMSGVMKIQKSPEVLKGFGELGYPVDILVGLGAVEIACVVVYLIPQTSVLGAILITGYLGGAVSAHVRHGDPWGQCLAPAVFGVIVWLGLVLRDERVRSLLPFRRG